MGWEFSCFLAPLTLPLSREGERGSVAMNLFPHGERG